MWVSADLSDDERADLKGRNINILELVDAVSAVVEEGFKLSVSWDERSDCAGVYLTAPKDRYGSLATCLSARAPSVVQALAVLFYKHFEKLGEDWSSGLKGEGKRDQWG